MTNKYQSTKTIQNQLTINDVFNGNIQFHNPKADIAEHAVSLLLGQGYSVDILKNGKIDEELKKKWKKIERFNKFSKIMEANEYDLSYDGFKVLTIEKLHDNILITQNDPNYFNKVATFQQISEISAVLYKKIIVDDISWMCKEEWDDMKVVRTWYKNDVAILNGLSVEIPIELKLPEVWHHNLGILPLTLFTNKNRNIVNVLEYRELADCATSEQKIKALNLMANQQLKEAIIHTTKIFSSASATQMKALTKKYGDKAGVELMLGQMLFNITQPGENTPNKPVEILQANPAFKQYIDAQADQLRHIWRAAGYTYMTGEESTATNADTLYANAFDIRTTKKKKTTRQEDYQNLIAKALICAGDITKEDYADGTIEIIFNIKENATQTPNQISDNQIKLVEAGLISKARALMKIEQLPNIEQAQEWIDEATEDLEKENELMLKHQEAMGMTEKDGTGNSEETASIEPNGVNE